MVLVVIYPRKIQAKSSFAKIGPDNRAVIHPVKKIQSEIGGVWKGAFEPQPVFMAVIPFVRLVIVCYERSGSGP